MRGEKGRGGEGKGNKTFGIPTQLLWATLRYPHKEHKEHRCGKWRN